MFGDYACDLPKNTLDLLLSHAKANHPEIEYIFLTGDYPAHDVWRQDRQHNIQSSQAIVKSITDNFPNMTVLPSLGRFHEFFFCLQFMSCLFTIFQETMRVFQSICFLTKTMMFQVNMIRPGCITN